MVLRRAGSVAAMGRTTFRSELEGSSMAGVTRHTWLGLVGRQITGAGTLDSGAGIFVQGALWKWR